MIESFRVQNYKALRDVEVKLTPMHVLIGPNDSGKTSVLEALRALCRSVDFRIEEAFVGGWSGRDLVTNGDDIDPVSLSMGYDNGSFAFDYALQCKFPGSGRAVRVAGEYFRSRGAPQWADLEGGDGASSAIFRGRDSMVAFSKTGPTTVGLVHGALSGVHYYRWDPRHLGLANAINAKRGYQMEASGFGLSGFLDHMLGRDRERFDAIERHFREIFPDFRSIKLVPESGYRAVSDVSSKVLNLEPMEGKGLHFELRASRTLVPAAQASDGVLLVLAYLAILHSPERPRVLLVEEPENGVHPKRLKEVLGILRELVKEQSHTQVLMTTHSPYVLDAFEPKEVSLCQKGEDGAVTIHPLSESKAVREQLDVFSLGEIWTAEGDEALARDGGNGVEKKQ